MVRVLDPLVSTKLRPSRARPEMVARPRLLERLNPEAGRRLTLVSAPAGFGKTTLLGEWVEARVDKGRPVAWLSLDEDDNDPVRFMSYLVAAIGRVVEGEGFGEGVLGALRSPEPPRMEAVLGALVNEISGLSGALDLVLDDYHAIDSEGVHRTVTFLVERLPDGAHLVISGRVDPPLPLARLRARDQMLRLGAPELAFTEAEAATFLRDVMGLDLSAGDVANLKGRTEGWIAGLQLAALSVQGREDLADFIRAFSGTHRDVLDFLADEVLERQPENVRGFLLETSVPERMNARLCDALTGRSDGQEMLEKLERENLFVVALDDERRWYRYHHLFAEFLRVRLSREAPERVGELHLRASGWYEENGHPAEAIAHALSVPDHERAARLIGVGSRLAWSRGEVPTVLRWLEALPAEAKRRRPRLALQHAMALSLTGRPDDAESVLDRTGREVESAGEDRTFLLGFVSAVRSWCSRLRGDAPHAVELAGRALSLLPEGEGGLRAFAAVVLGDALWTTGDLASADKALAEATRIGMSAGHVYSTLSAMTLHARVQAERGRLREAGETLDQARRFVEERGIELLPATAAVHVGIGALLYERDDLDGAERALEKGIGMAELTGNVTDLVWGYVTLSRARRARRDAEGAVRMAHEAARFAREYGADLEGAIAAAWMVRLVLLRGDPAEAAALERKRAAHEEGAAASARMLDRITSARLLHARGRQREALRLLAELGESAEANGRTRDLVEIQSLQALAHWSSNHKELAVGTVAKALELAAPEGYVRTFVDEGKTMTELLSEVLEARQRGRPGPAFPTHYPRKLLAALERDDAGARSPAKGLPDPPSARELEVLRLVAAGKSNRRIASELFVSVGTVKTHLNNIYRKLGTHSRTQAVARSRELDLI